MRTSFRAYAGDCTIEGQIELEGRLSDVLDRADEVRFSEAQLTSLSDGRQMGVGEMVLERDDLFAIEGHTSGGDDQRRVRMVRHVLRVEMGPYTCFGEMHALPGVAPLRTMLVRRTMVPLTNCLLLYRAGGREVARRMALLIVNGNRIRHVEEATSQQMENELAAVEQHTDTEQPASFA